VIKLRKVQAKSSTIPSDCGLKHKSVVLPTHFPVGRGTDFVDRQVSAVVFFFRAELEAQGDFEQAINHQTAEQSPTHAHRGAYQLRRQIDAA